MNFWSGLFIAICFGIAWMGAVLFIRGSASKDRPKEPQKDFSDPTLVQQLRELRERSVIRTGSADPKRAAR